MKEISILMAVDADACLSVYVFAQTREMTIEVNDESIAKALINKQSRKPISIA